MIISFNLLLMTQAVVVNIVYKFCLMMVAV